MTTKSHQGLKDSFLSMGTVDKGLVGATVITPVVMGFLVYQGVSNHFYEASHTTLKEGNITYKLTDAATVEQKSGGQTYTFDFQNNTVHVSDAGIKPQVRTANLQTFQTYSASRVRDQSAPAGTPADPAAAAQARDAGCKIADNLDKLSEKDAPLLGGTHDKIQQRGRAFKADFC